MTLNLIFRMNFRYIHPDVTNRGLMNTRNLNLYNNFIHD